MIKYYTLEDYCSEEITSLLEEKGYIGATNTYLDKDGFRVKEITLQSAMKWLREVHHCVICITPLTFYCGEIVSKWGYCIWVDDNTEVDEESSPRLESYEEACESAIKYCLENLI